MLIDRDKFEFSYQNLKKISKLVRTYYVNPYRLFFRGHYTNTPRLIQNLHYDKKRVLKAAAFANATGNSSY